MKSGVKSEEKLPKFGVHTGVVRSNTRSRPDESGPLSDETNTIRVRSPIVMDLDHETPLVIDIGGGMTTCGFAGDDLPRAVFPTVVGRYKSPQLMVGIGCKECFVGDEARAKRGVLNFNRPMQYRQVVETDWEDVDGIFRHTLYNTLCVAPEEQPILIAESPTNPPSQREKMTSLLFEKFNCFGMYLAVQQALALHASGRVTGVCLDSGYDITHAVPISESHAMSHSVKELKLGGRDITKRLGELLDEGGHEMSTTAEQEIVKDIKEKHAYVSLDFQEEAMRAEATAHCEDEYELPDGSKMTIGGERFRAPEILFQPSLCELDSPGIPALVADAIASVDAGLHKVMWENIVLCGGSSLFEGFVERMTKEFKFQGRSLEGVNVWAPAERKFSVWIGGSILSSLDSFNSSWILKEEYDEAGASIVQRKCT